MGHLARPSHCQGAFCPQPGPLGHCRRCDVVLGLILFPRSLQGGGDPDPSPSAGLAPRVRLGSAGTAAVGAVAGSWGSRAGGRAVSGGGREQGHAAPGSSSHSDSLLEKEQRSSDGSRAGSPCRRISGTRGPGTDGRGRASCGRVACCSLWRPERLGEGATPVAHVPAFWLQSPGR